MEVDGYEGEKDGEAVEVSREAACECLVAEESSKVVEGRMVGIVLSSIFVCLRLPQMCSLGVAIGINKRISPLLSPDYSLDERRIGVCQKSSSCDAREPEEGV